MKIRAEVFVHTLAGFPFNKDGVLVMAANDMTEFGYALVGKTWIEIDVDLEDVTTAQIRQLKEQIVKEQSKCIVNIGKLEQQISNLLCVENGGSS